MNTMILRSYFICIVLSAGIFATPVRAADNAPVSLYFLDVGQGDALIVHQPGSCAALVDGGPLLNGYRVTAKLRELQVDTLDLVIITHPHLDHFGGLFDLAPRIAIKQLYDNGATNEVWEYFDDYLQLKARQDHTILRRGDELSCGPVTFQVLFPDQHRDYGRDLNSGSLALLITYGTTRLLHMGDLAGLGAQDFLQMGDIPEVDILKVAHHGASDAAPQELIVKASPDYAVISTATKNRIRAPSDEVLERLEAAGLTVLRTDRNGSLHFIVDQSGYRLENR